MPGLLDHTWNSKGADWRCGDRTPSSTIAWTIHSREKKMQKGRPMLDGPPWDREVQHGPTRQIWNRGDVLSDIETKSKMERGTGP